MEIKLIIFDLDGVLVDSRPLHFESLNLALQEIDPKYIITKEEHLSTYDGLSTTTKLKLLTRNKNLSAEYHEQIWKSKQEHTITLIKDFIPDLRLINLLRELKNRNYTIYVASNSIWNTIKLMLLKKGFMEYIDYFISNQEVKETKPNPEIYLRAVIRSGFSPLETLIIEDSPIGRKAAISSGCHLLEVINPEDVTLNKILARIKEISNFDNPMNKPLPWLGKMNVVIPMAGAGSRFANAGYTFPKPLIEVNGKPMIQVVVENLNLKNANFIFIVRKEHYEAYDLDGTLNRITDNNCQIVISDGLTEGSTCSVLLAKEYIDNDIPLLIANSDQHFEGNMNEFLYQMENSEIDGGIMTFRNSHPKFSYVKLDNHGFVSEVAEKKVISNLATVGVYFWKRGSDFVESAEEMIKANFRVNNEFYTAPTFTYLISKGKKIKPFEVDKMNCLGTPEDLNTFLSK